MDINKTVLLMALLISLSVGIILTNHNVTAAEKKMKFDDNSALALNYHRIRDDNYFDKFLTVFSNSKELSDYSITETQFEEQIKWLKKHDAHFLTEKELLKYKEQGKFPKRSVWINFDDMDNSIYRNAHPILKKYKVPATGFVITGEVGTKNFHNLNMATLKQLKVMKRSGIWSFSSHTNDLHTLSADGNSKLTHTSNKALTSDLKKSNHYLKQELGINNQTLAYPYGQTKESKINATKQGDIKYAYTLEENAITPDDDNYYLPRILINESSFNHIIKKWEAFQQ